VTSELGRTLRFLSRPETSPGWWVFTDHPSKQKQFGFGTANETLRYLTWITSHWKAGSDGDRFICWDEIVVHILSMDCFSCFGLCFAYRSRDLGLCNLHYWPLAGNRTSVAGMRILRSNCQTNGTHCWPQGWISVAFENRLLFVILIKIIPCGSIWISDLISPKTQLYDMADSVRLWSTPKFFQKSM
jgi:hypothetical protein